MTTPTETESDYEKRLAAALRLLAWAQQQGHASAQFVDDEEGFVGVSCVSADGGWWDIGTRVVNGNAVFRVGALCPETSDVETALTLALRP